MKWDDADDHYTLSTGRKFYANNGILGLGPELDDLLSEGYDGTVWEDDERRDPDYKTFTKAERREIAAAMIDRWKRWAKR